MVVAVDWSSVAVGALVGLVCFPVSLGHEDWHLMVTADCTHRFVWVKGSLSDLGAS